MPKNTDEGFYDRADAHIHLSNDQLKALDSGGKVSASMLYGTARFNAWVSALGFSSGEQMAEAREQTLAYFTEQYRLMLASAQRAEGVQNRWGYSLRRR